jgi:DNA-binding NarL/FixJ family response regulator
VVVVEATQAPTAGLRDLVRPIRDAFDAAAVVLLLDEVIDDAFLVAGPEAGAAAIVDASAGMGEVIEAVRAAAEGERLIDSTRLATAVEAAARARESEGKRVDLLGLLSDREREVLSCLTRGKRNSEIAQELSISPRTVENHVHHILDKLEVGSRLAAVALATEMGGLTHPEMHGTG